MNALTEAEQMAINAIVACFRVSEVSEGISDADAERLVDAWMEKPDVKMPTELAAMALGLGIRLCNPAASERGRMMVATMRLRALVGFRHRGFHVVSNQSGNNHTFHLEPHPVDGLDAIVRRLRPAGRAAANELRRLRQPTWTRP